MIGLVFLANGVKSLSDTQDFVSKATRLQGKVVGFAEEPFNASVRPGSRSTTFYTAVKFVDPAGTSHRIKSQFGINWRLDKRGESLEFLFSSRNPDATKINSFQDVWLRPSVVLIVGIALLSWGAVLLRR